MTLSFLNTSYLELLFTSNYFISPLDIFYWLNLNSSLHLEPFYLGLLSKLKKMFCLMHNFFSMSWTFSLLPGRWFLTLILKWLLYDMKLDEQFRKIKLDVKFENYC